MATCPVCNCRIPIHKSLNLTRFNSILCKKCGNRLVLSKKSSMTFVTSASTLGVLISKISRDFNLSVIYVVIIIAVILVIMISAMIYVMKLEVKTSNGDKK